MEAGLLRSLCIKSNIQLSGKLRNILDSLKEAAKKGEFGIIYTEELNSNETETLTKLSYTVDYHTTEQKYIIKF